jgi:hypothetical protein
VSSDSFEGLLRQALTPVNPPADLEQRLEETLGSIVEAAADELESWEIGSMHDPRNWVRPAAAAVVGGTAAVGLVIVRTQRKRHRRKAQSANTLDLVERTIRDLRHEARRLLDDPRR